MSLSGILLALLLPLAFVGVCIFSLLDRIYRELGRVASGRLRQRLERFETAVEPGLGFERKTAAMLASLTADLWLAVLLLSTVLAILHADGSRVELVGELTGALVAEIVLGRQVIPSLLLLRAEPDWLGALVPLLRLWFLSLRPLAAVVSFSSIVAELGDEETMPEQEQEERIEALVEAAQEEGLLHGHEAQLIEQVVEFSDKRVRDLMTPRPDVVAIPASATIADLRRVLVETRFSRLPVYEGTLDEIVGIVHARDVLQVPEQEAARRLVRELMRPALLVPETKLGSELLREMRQKQQQMAVAIDEYGQVAGVVTMEDLVEEILGEIGDEDRKPSPEILLEGPGTAVLRGSTSLDKLQKALGIELERERVGPATTLAGLLNHLTGRVPAPGEVIEYNGLRFEVLEANQRKVLRVRARRVDTGVQPPTA